MHRAYSSDQSPATDALVSGLTSRGCNAHCCFCTTKTNAGYTAPQELVRMRSVCEAHLGSGNRLGRVLWCGREPMFSQAGTRPGSFPGSTLGRAARARCTSVATVMSPSTRSRSVLLFEEPMLYSRYGSKTYELPVVLRSFEAPYHW